jgi:hypothetical protein
MKKAPKLYHSNQCHCDDEALWRRVYQQVGRRQIWRSLINHFFTLTDIEIVFETNSTSKRKASIVVVACVLAESGLRRKI